MSRDSPVPASHPAPAGREATIVARRLDNCQTLEVTRTATDGARNTNSPLCGASWRAAKVLGYPRLIT
ncbi:XF1762 family protein [Kitasatospora sp. NPDC059327]|uniref:XF1762 family protein n=1 Tax=Kitasatospora sp. NPDC059327 TaxID=3346803 RepID=UPI00368B628B